MYGEKTGWTKGLTKVLSRGSVMWREKGNDMTAKKVYLREYSCSRSVGRPRKRWIDIVKD